MRELEKLNIWDLCCTYFLYNLGVCNGSAIGSALATSGGFSNISDIVNKLMMSTVVNLQHWQTRLLFLLKFFLLISLL